MRKTAWISTAAVIVLLSQPGPADAARPATAKKKPARPAYRLPVGRAVIEGQDRVQAPAGEWVLWYRKPAGRWTEALPVGNGRMGAMVFGGVDVERIQFNEDTLWTGRPQDYQHPGAAKSLPEVGMLLRAHEL
ncbi:MAG: glycoside hydrolase N-terminal domain-containing protein [Planctomycetes bacterium]|nr:glycoside hydrolase N-terminal domain-containing protein [Planctomycetota bacterium]